MLTAAVVTSDTASSSSLRASLQQTGHVASLREWIVTADNHIGSAEAVPDVVLLDLSGDSEPFFTLAAQLRRLRPSVRIIACSNLQQPTPELLLQAMRSGVQEFLTKPLSPADLAATLGIFVQERAAAGLRVTEKLIVVLGSKGGVGTTTVAVNLGVQLAHVTKQRVSLLDFARPLGQVSLHLDLRPRYSLRDAIENLDRLDGHFFAGLLTRHRTGLDVLAGTSHPEEWQSLSDEALARAISVAQMASDLVVLDCGTRCAPIWAPQLRSARAILIVAEPDVPSLWALERHLAAILAMEIEPDKIHVVLNRWRRKDEEALENVERRIKRPIALRLPNDFPLVSTSVNTGQPLNGNNKNNELVMKLRQFASQLAGLSSAPPQKRAGFGLFSPGVRR